MKNENKVIEILYRCLVCQQTYTYILFPIEQPFCFSCGKNKVEKVTGNYRKSFSIASILYDDKIIKDTKYKYILKDKHYQNNQNKKSNFRRK